MAFNNIIPFWVLEIDGIMNQYEKGERLPHECIRELRKIGKHSGIVEEITNNHIKDIEANEEMKYRV